MSIAAPHARTLQVEDDRVLPGPILLEPALVADILLAHAADAALDIQLLVGGDGAGLEEVARHGTARRHPHPRAEDLEAEQRRYLAQVHQVDVPTEPHRQLADPPEIVPTQLQLAIRQDRNVDVAVLPGAAVGEAAVDPHAQGLGENLLDRARDLGRVDRDRRVGFGAEQPIGWGWRQHGPLLPRSRSGRMAESY